jgi:hypothetical protein
MRALLWNLDIVILMDPFLGGCATGPAMRRRANRLTFEDIMVQFMVLLADMGRSRIRMGS